MSGEWIEYDGNARQEPEAITGSFDVKTRDGRVYDGLSKGLLAKECWFHIFGNSDIVAYRIIEPHEPASSSKAANS